MFKKLLLGIVFTLGTLLLLSAIFVIFVVVAASLI